MLDKILELQKRNSEHLVFNNFIEIQTTLKLLFDKNIITADEFENEKRKIIKGMIVEGITNGVFTDEISKLFKNQLERLDELENKGA